MHYHTSIRRLDELIIQSSYVLPRKVGKYNWNRRRFCRNSSKNQFNGKFFTLSTLWMLFVKFNTEIQITHYCSSTNMMNYFNVHFDSLNY